MIKFYTRKFHIKLIILFLLSLIALASLWVTHDLVKNLAKEEKKKIELWASANEELSKQQEDENRDYSFVFKVLEENNTVPTILTDGNNEIIGSRNIDSLKISTKERAAKMIKMMSAKHKPFVITISEKEKNLLYYDDSTILKKLYYFPIVQLIVLILFIFAAYLAFSSIRNSEQNLVWVGMAKETAHQLGTPTSSLLAWLEVLKDNELPDTLLVELDRDIHRLEKITDRFSKIGSSPSLRSLNLIDQIENSIGYLQKRISGSIVFVKKYNPNEEVYVKINESLFEWVLENLVKNAIDAMQGKGTITFTVRDDIQVAYIDINDQGKGVPKNIAKTIFKPGFTTKERGWGLGLSLSKRIIEDYHKGKIFVLQSDSVRGTTFRIVLKK
ncbi:ATP-binding protein [Williamwhitmania taraxaci]|uniref:histidine kinase n=1 Tax=Williamwhitmania taraxaci TaxID=1640674 RepID=A0A1G6GXX4_9BACT|nr:HAMP domain-containing sensor histidine kinase [Williamwhitmania taraxaci]SDB86910.1 Histidine kinase-, DNA gyrase B-, and HSP90-like ATPase [Williamwhitmania taraxaci]